MTDEQCMAIVEDIQVATNYGGSVRTQVSVTRTLKDGEVETFTLSTSVTPEYLGNVTKGLHALAAHFAGREIVSSPSVMPWVTEET